jgi:hypothetical protein
MLKGPHRVAWLSSAVVAALLGACSEKPKPVPAPPPPAASLAVDRLLPGELTEGHERALGLAIPREMQLERAFNDSAQARGPVDLEPLANYVRRRVDAATVEIGAARTMFPRAHIKGTPDAKLVRIEVVRESTTTLLVVTDISPPPVEPGLSDAERWKKAGVMPGKPFDPNAL